MSMSNTATRIRSSRFMKKALMLMLFMGLGTAALSLSGCYQCIDAEGNTYACN
jgi:hypothetical protein